LDRSETRFYGFVSGGLFGFSPFVDAKLSRQKPANKPISASFFYRKMLKENLKALIAKGFSKIAA
jgi:hypothetical protein